MKERLIYLVLLAIILLAGVIRFYKLSEIPVSLYWDEVSMAYNAFSILETSKDEFGTKFPLLFRAFEDYKTPANIYLTAIAVKLFGLNEFSVRFTSAIFGTLTVLATFFLTREIVRKKIFDIQVEYIALLASFLLAISPWHIQFSRAGFEANSGLFFVVLGAFLLLKYLNTSSYKFLLFSMISYAASIYFYRSIWLFVPLFLFSIFIINFKTFFSKEKLKKTILAVSLFMILILPFVPEMVSPRGMVRTQQVSVVNNSQEKVFESVKKIDDSDAIGKVIYNRRIVYGSEILKNYFSHFLPNFLFFNGDGNGRHGVKGVGVLYLWAIIFIVPGLLALRKIERKTTLALLAWIIIAPIPAAISIPSPHALRSLNVLPIPQIILSLGIFYVYFYVGRKYTMLFSAFMIGMIMYFFINYISLYSSSNAKVESAMWGDGYKALTGYMFSNQDKYEKVIVSGHYWQPYVYFLFYKKYDPLTFQKSGSKSGFDKFVFGGTQWDKDLNGRELGDQDLKKMSGTKNYIVALSPQEFKDQKENLVVVNEIRNHNNELVFIIAKPK